MYAVNRISDHFLSLASFLQTTVTAAYKNTKVANTIATDVSAGGIPGKKLQKTSTSNVADGSTQGFAN
jgi:hypothetical protein